MCVTFGRMTLMRRLYPSTAQTCFYFVDLFVSLSSPWFFCFGLPACTRLVTTSTSHHFSVSPDASLPEKRSNIPINLQPLLRSWIELRWPLTNPVSVPSVWCVSFTCSERVFPIDCKLYRHSTILAVVLWVVFLQWTVDIYALPICIKYILNNVLYTNVY